MHAKRLPVRPAPDSADTHRSCSRRFGALAAAAAGWVMQTDLPSGRSIRREFRVQLKWEPAAQPLQLPRSYFAATRPRTDCSNWSQCPHDRLNLDRAHTLAIMRGALHVLSTTWLFWSHQVTHRSSRCWSTANLGTGLAAASTEVARVRQADARPRTPSRWASSLQTHCKE